MEFAAFLGTGNYKETIYYRDGWKASTKYVQTAALLYLKEIGVTIGRVTIFATEKAQNEHGNGLMNELQTHQLKFEKGVRVVDVETGFTTEEARRIFQILKDRLLDSGEAETELYWDMTHGFRAQPALAQMVFGYLKNTPQSLIIKDIFYGAFNFDAQERTQLVSLMELWALNDWSEAFAQFNRSGRTQYLAELIEATRRRISKMQSQKGSQDFPNLDSLQKALVSWDDYVQMNYIPGLFGPDGQIEKLYQELRKTQDELTRDAALYVLPLQEHMASVLQPMRTEQQWWELGGLEAQFELMKWLTQCGQYVQAVTLAREWNVTWLQWMLSIPDERATAEELWSMIDHEGNQQEEGRQNNRKLSVALFPAFQRLIRAHGLVDLIAGVQDVQRLRNGLNHGWLPRNSVTGASTSIPRSISAELDNKLQAVERLLGAAKSAE